jgi:predicted PurR-regulated permease PerM
VSSGNGVNPKRRKSTRPYRDSALAYAALGSLVVIFAYVTGSSLVRSVAGGLIAFVLATAYTWWRVRTRERQAAERP